MRWLAYTVGTALVAGALAYLWWSNPGSVELRLGERVVLHAPLALHLLVAFGAGAGLVLVGAVMRESRRAVAEWRRRRRARKEARVQALVREAREALWAGAADRARSLLLRAWKARPSREAALLLAEACLQTDSAGEVRRLFEQAETGIAEDPDVLWALARVCEQVGDRVGAITALERIRARHPRATPVLLRLRNLYIEAGRWEEAASVHAAYAAARTQTPFDRELLAGIRYESAMRIPGREARLSALEEIVSAYPGFVPAAVSFGDELAQAGRTTDASRVWEQALRNSPRLVLAERLASVAGDAKARERLRTLVRKLRANRLDENAVRWFQARLHLEDGNDDAAEKELEGVAPEARSTPYYLTAGDVQRKRQQNAEAARLYREAATLAPLYRCTGCGRAANGWVAFCSSCRRWDSYRAVLDFVRETPA
ncbi:MAG: hypothetical protein KatS3mg076_1629 [Candidatus Binatia bacterium]|nr:MAG: hypothetical protein KatS3mg076_1629 [Candidatus Binatia bacterium]